LSIKKQCDLLGVSRSGYYYKPEPVSQEKLQLINKVDEIYTEFPFFGTRRMAAYLQRYGYNIGRKKVKSIYEILGLEAVYPKPNTSQPNKQHTKYPYLLRDVEIIKCNHVWSSDITYIRLCGGYIYLMAIIDWFSRYVLDWEISISLEADFCIETLGRLLHESSCEIFNTDQGSQFTCHKFVDLLLQKQIKVSMDGKGRCLDNVFVERLWRSLKYECIYMLSLNTVKEAKKEIRKYFEFYNSRRPHQSLGYKTPAEVYFSKNG
jgi:putative transposase